MKRKCEKVLLSRQWHDVLVIDPEDDRYPYKREPDEANLNPPRWGVRKFYEIDPLGIVLIVRQFYAFIAEDNKGWDYVESVGIGGDEHLSDRPREDNDSWKHETRVRRFWRALPDDRQAWYMHLIAIRFEDILDIDEAGDAAYTFPHIFPARTAPLTRFAILESLQRFSPARVDPDPNTRVKFFPDEFPEPPPVPVPD